VTSRPHLLEAARAADIPSIMQRNPPTLVSIVIPTFNSSPFLDDQLASLAEQDYPGDIEVIISDNGSTDGTPETALAWSDRLPLRVVDSSDQQGVGYATSVGTFCANGDLIVCADHDDVAAPTWLSALVAAARFADLVGGPNECERLNSPRALASRYWTKPIDRPTLICSFLPAVFTNNFAVWVDVLESLGGFRQSYGPGSDIEISWRAQLHGFKLGFAPDAIMHYRFRDNVRELAVQQYGYGRANVQLYRDFHQYGLEHQVGRAIWEWVLLVARVPFMIFPRRRDRWVGDVAFRLGRLRGCLEHRCIFP
jgi:glycosyltransferase involved in cell wall biosynthesis